VIEDVEELSPEVQPYRLSQTKSPVNAYIRLGRVETAQHVASEIPLRTGGYGVKAAALKILPPG